MNINEPIITHETPQSIIASEGGINSYCISCPATDRQAGYPVCLHVIKALEENRLPSDQFVDCQRALAHDNCKARFMRTLEREAGLALFYRPRNPFQEQQEAIRRPPPRPKAHVPPETTQALKDRYPSLRGKDYVASVPAPREQLKQKPGTPVDTGPVAMDLGALATQIAKEAAVKKTKVVNPAIASGKPNPGESMRDWIFRKQKEKAQEATHA